MDLPIGAEMRVGVLGSGEVAQALGRGFASRTHEVMLGTRTPGPRNLDHAFRMLHK
jgi:hypothetical protein